MCLTGRMMDAGEAERAGLVSRVVPAADLLGEAVKAAEKIAAREAAMTKQILTGHPVGHVMGNKYELMLQGGVYDVG